VGDALTRKTLRQQNDVFRGTRGVSGCNRSSGFVPAFCDSETGRIELARFANGNPAPMHLLEGLPAEWAEDRDACGRIVAARASLIAGFLKGGRFYTREEAAACCHAGTADPS
jgi:hypothetical protein